MLVEGIREERWKRMASGALTFAAGAASFYALMEVLGHPLTLWGQLRLIGLGLLAPAAAVVFVGWTEQRSSSGPQFYP